MTTKIKGDQLDTGTGANQIVQLNGSSQLPAVDGSLLTGVASEAYVDTNDRLGINTQGGTTYTLALTDENALVNMTGTTSAITVTIPTNISVAFPIGTQILVSQEGDQQVTIDGPGVTLHSAGNFFDLASQYTTISLIKKASDTWLLVGDLA